jgi:Asp-tRNA(Asn)/Glu-tRNA(Gln) amidotransferase A subunit family amidase
MFSLPWRGAHNGTAREQVPPGPSGAYERLRGAGAVIVGVAQQHELGMGSTGRFSAYGPVRNPHDPVRIAGGSSGGSAAAVAARLVAGSVGSDSGGSTRIPAAYCGVVGLKLTWGAVPTAGYTGAYTTLSAVGAFGGDAGDARLLAEVLTGRTLAAGDAAGLRVGLPAALWRGLDPGVERACRAALTRAGWETQDLDLPAVDLAPAVVLLRISAEAQAGLDPDVLAGLHPLTRAAVHWSGAQPAPLLLRADRVRGLLRRATADAFRQHHLLAAPAVPAPAPPLDDPTPVDAANIRQAALANATGVPGISVPVGPHEPTGLPVGLQLLAPWGEEARLLDAAVLLEQTQG